jgi:hypothetical protein
VIAVTASKTKPEPFLSQEKGVLRWTRADPFILPPKKTILPNRHDLDDIPFIIPANDNVQTKDGLSARRGSLLRRLLALHYLRWPD